MKMGSSYGSASVEGLGVAIPISDAKEIITSLINNCYVTGRPQLGITGVTVTESDPRYFWTCVKGYRSFGFDPEFLYEAYERSARH